MSGTTQGLISPEAARQLEEDVRAVTEFDGSDPEPIGFGRLGGSELEPALQQRPPAPMPPPPSAVIAWMRQVVAWQESLGGAK